MNLEEVNSYKNKIISILHNSEEIQEELIPKDIFDDCDVDDELDKHIFKYLFVPDTETTVGSYIGVEITTPKVLDFSLKNLSIVIDIWSHKDDINYSKTWNRPDKICNTIKILLDTSRDFGIGRLKFDGDSLLQIDRKFYGKSMRFIATDFNTNKKL